MKLRVRTVRTRMKNILALLSLMALISLTSGCVITLGPGIKSNVEDLEARAAKFKTILLLPPEIEISELSAGGVEEKRDDWGDQGKKNVEKALSELLQEKKVRLKVLKENKKNKKEIEDINALYRAVAYSIYSHTKNMGYNPNIFMQRIENFDYTIGSVEDLLKREKADGLLIVYGADEISTSGRKVLRALKNINPFSQGERGDLTSMLISITDKKGDVLWFNTFVDGGHDLREAKSTLAFVEKALKQYPGGEK